MIYSFKPLRMHLRDGLNADDWAESGMCTRHTTPNHNHFRDQWRVSRVDDSPGSTVSASRITPLGLWM